MVPSFLSSSYLVFYQCSLFSLSISTFFLFSHLLFYSLPSDFCSFHLAFFYGNIKGSDFWFDPFSDRQTTVKNRGNRREKERSCIFLLKLFCVCVFLYLCANIMYVGIPYTSDRYHIACVRSGYPALSPERADVTGTLVMWLGGMVPTKW